MTGPRLLDLFAGAGGCSVGYARAGFSVTGVDNRSMPRYPFEFIQADAMDVLADVEFLSQFDAIHASPPCHDHSPLKSRSGDDGTGWLLDATREALIASGVPYVIENVAGANMPTSMMLCGSMFGLRVYRHRRFEIDMRFGMLTIPSHPKHRVLTSTKKRMRDWEAGLNVSVTGDIGTTIGSLALDIDWMNGNELSQAIPPAYTELIGSQLLDHLTAGLDVSRPSSPAPARTLAPSPPCADGRPTRHPLGVPGRSNN